MVLISKTIENLIGRTFGRLTVLCRAEDYVYPNGRHRTRWHCECACGNTVDVEASNLKRGNSKSCGCYDLELKHNRIKHGGRHERLYGVWTNIKNRCNNVASEDYQDYGGRGIKICDEWNDSYETFRSWAIKSGYNDEAAKSECTIDRIDVNGNYEPDNCRWVNAKKQANNRRNTLTYTAFGETHSLSEWSDITGVKYHTLFARVNRLGWPLEKALKQ